VFSKLSPPRACRTAERGGPKLLDVNQGNSPANILFGSIRALARLVAVRDYRGGREPLSKAAIGGRGQERSLLSKPWEGQSPFAVEGRRDTLRGRVQASQYSPTLGPPLAGGRTEEKKKKKKSYWPLVRINPIVVT